MASKRAANPETAAEDLRLVAAILRRDRKATAEFVERYSDPLYAYLCRRLTPRTDLAGDLLQEVFLAALESLPGFEGRSALKTWLFSIARHKVEEHFRSRLRSPSLLPEEEADLAEIGVTEPKLDMEIDQARLEEKTRRILGTLPEPYSNALVWRYWGKCSVAEMASRTGRTAKAMERLLSRARALFKRRWNDE